MRPFYFSEQEARFLGNIPLLSTALLQNCAAHDLAPFLEYVFDLDEGFHREPGFSAEKEAWILKRCAELACPQQEKSRPDFSAKCANWLVRNCAGMSDLTIAEDFLANAIKMTTHTKPFVQFGTRREKCV
jgi:hypothetical protein